MEEQDYPIRVNVAIGRSPDEVWPYITEVEHWNEWNAASLSSAEWEEGGKLNWKVGGFSSILAPLIPARTVHFQLVGVFTQDTVFTLEPSGDGRSTEFALHEKYMGVALSDGGATKRARWESDLARLKNLVESGATPVSVSEEGEPFLGRIRELIAAGEKFEAMKLYAKTTGKGPDLAKKYVDEVASRMSGGHGSSIRAERREVTIVGKTLEEAHAKLQALISTDGLLLKSKIANKGERRITESGSTVDEAFAKAEKKLLGEEEVIRRRVISEPVERTVTVKAPDPDHARDRAKQSLAKAEKVAQVTELTAGRRRLLGLVSAVNEYCVVIRVKKAVVEVVCSCPAEIRATISQSEQVGENSASETAGTRVRSTSGEPASQSSLTDQLQCVTCSKVLEDWHYGFESVILGRGLGWQCSNCGQAFCMEHAPSTFESSGDKCSCGGWVSPLDEGPALSSMVDAANRDGKYGRHFHPPGSKRNVRQE